MTRRRFQDSLQAFSLASALVLGAAVPLAAQMPRPEKASLHLEADRTGYEAGSTVRIAALVKIDEGWHVNSDKPTFEYLIPTVLDLQPPAGWGDEKVQYPQAEMQAFKFSMNEPLSVFDGEVVIFAELQVPAGTPAGVHPLKATLDYQACNDSQCLPPVTTEAELTLHIGEGGKPVESAAFNAPPTGPPSNTPPAAAEPAPAAQSAAEPAAAPAETSLLWMLLLGLVGGLILNAMPCVLPVLSLKVFGLVKSAGHGRREVTRGTLATSAGILVSFWALALIAVLVRAAGGAVGWGIQFQHPGFVAFLAVVVVLFCLNLWGLFEITLPQRFAQVGGASYREGISGHFFSGLFATLMATPCSAPFLGTAIGFALSQQALQVFAVFTAIGLGMALPYLTLAVAPGAARFLPRPGAWMETMRGIMGFLLAASAVWLFYVLAAQVPPERVAGLQLALLGLALFTWLRHRGPAGAGFRRAAALGMAVAVAAVLGVASWQRAEGTAQAAGARTGGSAKAAALIPWEDFDRAKAESLASEGNLVFVDVTADWCFTCKVNERLVLETPEVAGVFEEHGVIPMKA
ncbi:MAG TPA: protein-disulfide reductase DsbD domain-containing protein, partial [Thermoanaerobaculia bacterium]|nr:protein-disulfide reductase DsbD domain-containing protein [Thermoanaerobaculia bacterium]